MRIAMIGQKGIPAHSGGVEQHVDTLSRLLSERGHEVTVYCRRSYCSESASLSGRATDQSARLRHVFRASIPTKHLDAITHTITSTVDVLFREVDIVHYHAIGPAALAPLARMRGLPTVVTCHGLDWQRSKWGRAAQHCLKLGEWIAARCASQLVVVSEPLRDHFQSVHNQRATFIPNGVVPIERRMPNRISQWNLRPRQYFLAASRLVREKGLHYLIPAFQALETDVRLVIAGGGGLDPSYEHELRQMSGARVVFTGNADRELMAELYSNALAFVLPSELEGMSIALLEAMSCGLPVVVSDIPENACVVGDDGFKFRSRDPAHLTEVLTTVLEHREWLSEFGQRCRTRAARYDWAHVASQLERVYASVLGIQLDEGTELDDPSLDLAYAGIDARNGTVSGPVANSESTVDARDLRVDDTSTHHAD